jgi:heterodisulfide reductase subunit C2
MDAINLTSSSDAGFIERVARESGENPSLCYQCGNCTAGCVYTPYFDYPVSKVMRLIQAGQGETVLDSKAIWLCATCETCTTRCPCEIDVAHIMDTLRNMAFKEGRYTEKDVKSFYESFLKSLKGHGRIFELGILMRYKLTTGHLFADAALGPKVMAKGLMKLMPKNIKGRDEVLRIFKKFAEKRRQHG